MSGIKELYLNVAEGLGVSPAQLLNQINGSQPDKEWAEHTTLHVGNPSLNCTFCLQNVEFPESDEMEDYAD
jgi:hypothetical protein